MSSNTDNTIKLPDFISEDLDNINSKQNKSDAAEDSANKDQALQISRHRKSRNVSNNQHYGHSKQKTYVKGSYNYKKRDSYNVNEEESNEDNNSEQNEDHNTQNTDRQTFYMDALKEKSPSELLEVAESLGVDNPSILQKHDLIFAILKCMASKDHIVIGEGSLEILQDGYGFLRAYDANYVPGADDLYVSPGQIKRFALRTGDNVRGVLRMPKKNERYFALSNVLEINGYDVEKNKRRVYFEDLTPLFPNQMIVTENKKYQSLSTRIIDMLSPLGRGQRALVVAPPRTGKTVLMKDIAHAISENYPEINLIVLLIDERPEEVTDMKRSVKGEVLSSTFDEPSNRHVQLAEMVIEKAKRLVENDKDVVILLDSITRLARAYNNIAPSSGKVLSGGVDSNALQRPKRFFGAARNTEECGSLTIIATALVDTGSRMDEVIFEEFKGTGNAEIVLDRRIAEKRIFPAIDIAKSGTRREDLLIDGATLTKIWVLRRIISSMNTTEAIDFLIKKLECTESNEKFFESMNKSSQ